MNTLLHQKKTSLQYYLIVTSLLYVAYGLVFLFFPLTISFVRLDPSLASMSLTATWGAFFLSDGMFALIVGFLGSKNLYWVSISLLAALSAMWGMMALLITLNDHLNLPISLLWGWITWIHISHVRCTHLTEEELSALVEQTRAKLNETPRPVNESLVESIVAGDFLTKTAPPVVPSKP